MFNQNHLGGEPERKHNCALSTNQIAEKCSKNLLTSILIGREGGCTETNVLKSDILKFTNELSDWSRAWSAGVIRLDQRPDQKLICPEWRPDQPWAETWSKLIRPEWRPDRSWSDLNGDLIKVDQTWVETWSRWSDLSGDLIKVIRREWRPDQT